MSAFSYCILLVFFLHQRTTAADNETLVKAEKYDAKKWGPTIIQQLSETLDLVCEINSKLNETEKDLNQLKMDLRQSRDSTDVIKQQLNKHCVMDHQIREINCKSCMQGPRDCSDIRAMGFTESGVYHIYPGSDNKRIQADVFCDLRSFNESWLVFQRRMDGSENFERFYAEYEHGFGNLTGEFWLGNELLHLLTANRKYKLRIDLEDFEGAKRYAEYSTFHVNSSKDFYRLTVRGYFGNAGDSLAIHNNMRFTTKDVDNDPASGNCAREYRGAWWYHVCINTNLNGIYRGARNKAFTDGITWFHWHPYDYSLKATEMKIMPLEG